MEQILVRKDVGRLSPFKDDKPKDVENSPFQASSVLVVKAINKSDFMICYVINSWGGASKALNYAMEKKLTVYNIAK